MQHQVLLQSVPRIHSAAAALEAPDHGALVASSVSTRAREMRCGGAAVLAGVAATVLAVSTGAASAAHPTPVPTQEQVAMMDVGISQFLCYNIDPFATPHVEHNCVKGPPCLSTSLFKPTNQSTDQWVQTAKAMGATELVVTVHHEGGFCLWPSKYSNYTVAQTPWGTSGGDIVADFVASCRKYGIRPAMYWGPNAAGNLVWDGMNADEFIAAQKGQLKELLTHYGPIARLWVSVRAVWVWWSYL